MRNLFPAGLVALLFALPAAGQQDPAASFLESVEVRVIDVDVVVLDADGRPVRGLTRDDFELFEDGRAVEIANFLAYDEEVTVSAAADAASPAPAAPPAPPANAAPSATWVLYLDQERLEQGPRLEVLRQLSVFVRDSMRPGDRLMVATYDGGSLRVESPLGTEVAPALAALDGLTRKRGNVSSTESRRSFVQRQILTVDLTSRTAADEAQAILGEIEQIADEETLRGRQQVGAARDLLALLAGLEGRVAILYAGAGYESRPAAALYDLWSSKFAALLGPLTTAGASSRELDPRWIEVQAEYRRLMEAANAGRFTFYALLAGRRGPDISAETPRDSSLVSATSAIGASSDLAQASSLAGLADETGGRTLVSAPDLARRLETVRRDLVPYYSLGYPPEGAEPGRRRRLEVRLRPPGLRAQVRRSATDSSGEERAAAATVATLLSDSEPQNALGVTVEVGTPAPAANKRSEALVPVVVRVPLAQVSLLPEAARHRARLVFHFAIQDPDGGYRRLEAKPLEFEVPNDKVGVAVGQHVSFRIELALAPGRYRLGVGVLDELAGTVAIQTAPVEVAKR